MKRPLSRRNFLQLASLASLAPLASRLPAAPPPAASPLPNVIIFLLDALSAAHLSVYGYPRRTSPNLERLAQRATVYHRHYSAGNCTTPSTASLFTGVYPWGHRAFSIGGVIASGRHTRNLFRLLNRYSCRFAYTQNLNVDILLHQLQADLDRHERLDSFAQSGRVLYSTFFDHDSVPAIKSLDEFMFKRDETHGSLFLSLLYDLQHRLQTRISERQLADLYPNGLPRLIATEVRFLPSQVTEGLQRWLAELPRPFLSYIHLLPPHAPYTPSRRFLGMFSDGWSLPPKPLHRLAPTPPYEDVDRRRQVYDEYIANLDDEFGRLLDYLERSGLLDNSIVIFTSDHGELFERGIYGHATPALFEGVIRVPLIISQPGQTAPQHIYTPTSTVDLLPTLLRVAGQPIPEWCEGQPLPGIGGEQAAERSVFVVEAKTNPAHTPLQRASLALIKGRYKFLSYRGYPGIEDFYELYDLEDDPAELQNLYPDHPMAAVLQAELTERLAVADRPPGSAR